MDRIHSSEFLVFEEGAIADLVDPLGETYKMLQFKGHFIGAENVRVEYSVVLSEEDLKNFSDNLVKNLNR